MLLFSADLDQIEVRGPQSKRGTHIKLCDPEEDISLPECRETNFAMGNNVGAEKSREYFRYLADRGEYVSADLEDQLSRAVEDTGREMRFERTRPDGPDG